MNEIRLKKLRALVDAEGSLAAVGRKYGADPTYISQLLNGHRSFGEKAARNLEEKLGKPKGWFDSDDASNVAFAPDTRGRVPVISWVQAGDWRNAVDNFHPGQADEWVDITCPQKEHTFALRVKGDSMVNPGGAPSFPEGFILVVEPEMDFSPGDFVIAKNGDNEATFKQLVKDGGDWYLKPLNPNYRMKPLGNAQIVGVVREAILKFK